EGRETTNHRFFMAPPRQADDPVRSIALQPRNVVQTTNPGSVTEGAIWITKKSRSRRGSAAETVAEARIWHKFPFPRYARGTTRRAPIGRGVFTKCQPGDSAGVAAETEWVPIFSGAARPGGTDGLATGCFGVY